MFTQIVSLFILVSPLPFWVFILLHWLDCVRGDALWCHHSVSLIPAYGWEQLSALLRCGLKKNLAGCIALAWSSPFVPQTITDTDPLPFDREHCGGSPTSNWPLPHMPVPWCKSGQSISQSITQLGCVINTIDGVGGGGRCLHSRNSFSHCPRD